MVYPICLPYVEAQQESLYWRDNLLVLGISKGIGTFFLAAVLIQIHIYTYCFTMRVNNYLS